MARPKSALSAISLMSLEHLLFDCCWVRAVWFGLGLQMNRVIHELELSGDWLVRKKLVSLRETRLDQISSFSK